ncbi:MAG: phosphonopyruvate decarboxylase [Lachnospiraceae bacterium]|nr:phosphonopyruvate decarboxylase [Lachnospiraceae bacterium]
MKVEKFVEILNSDFYVGVPDSQLKSLCGYLMNTYGIDPKHYIIAANEGNCVGIAAGYHLATGKIPVVFMQNSGEGNIINPLASLMNEKVYGIPCVFVVGWRGEPGVHDEPQHIYQGEITLRLLDVMGVDYFVVDKDTTEMELEDVMKRFNDKLSEGHDVAFVIKKDALDYDNKAVYRNSYAMKREEVIKHIVNVAGQDLIVSTTGKASRELFEIREENGQGHDRDFLTVGSMGHSSSIALGVALQEPNKKVWCIDGDGAMLMHMGAMAVIGAAAPANMVHIVINNEAHESVGGMPTVAGKMNIVDAARACGYINVISVDNEEDLDKILWKVKTRNELSMIEIKCSIGARDDLGRPTISPIDNKLMFMRNNI